ncbi:MAG: hypothetical protein Fur0021_37190 [Candidatus Promineifilaceae bacterium]
MVKEITTIYWRVTAALGGAIERYQAMEQQIRDRYCDAVLQEAMRRYGITSSQIRALDAFESFIYEFERGPDAYILRIAHSLRRSEALILGEVDWINYLAAGGVSVARAIASEAGKLVEAIADEQGGGFYCAFRGVTPGLEQVDTGAATNCHATFSLCGECRAFSGAADA